MTPDSSDAPRAHHTPRLDQLRKQAKKLLRAVRDNDPAAIDQLKAAVPRVAQTPRADIPESAQLADAQHAIARHEGRESWPKLKAELELAEPAQFFLKKFRDAILSNDETEARRIFAGQYESAGFYTPYRRVMQLARDGNLAEARQLEQSHPGGAELAATVACCVGNSEFISEWLEYRTRHVPGGKDALSLLSEGAQDNTTEALAASRQNTYALLLCCASPFFKDSAARANGILRCVELFLEAGADPNSHMLVGDGDEKGKIPALFFASVAGNTAVMKMLFEYGADPNDGESVPHAAEMNRRDSLEVLLEYGADLSGRLPVVNNTPLHFLAVQLWDQRRYDNIMNGMRWLLEHGADPNVSCHPSLETPLHAAAQTARGLDAVKLLLEHGADFTAQRADGRRPLSIAVRNGHEAIAALLDRPGSGVSHVDRLLGAAMRGAENEATAILQQHPGLMAKFTDEDRGMVANTVFLGNSNSSVTLMAKLGFDLAWENEWGGSALHLAAWFGKVEMVRDLIQLGAPINLRDSKYGSSPLAWAGHGSANSRSADDDYCAVIQMLINAGSTPDAALNKWNESPSSMATRKVAKLLRRHGF